MYREKHAYNEDRDYAVKSRRAVFEKEMESLKRLMYGGSVRIWPYMSDFWGKYSEERTVSFVEQIINEEWYERMHRGEYERYSHKLPFYRKLLYCVLRILTADYTDYRGGNVVNFGECEKKTFSDVADVFLTDDGAILDSFTISFAELFYSLLTQKSIRLPFRDPKHEEAERQLREAEEAWKRDGIPEGDEAAEEEPDEFWIMAEEKGLDIEELGQDEIREFELGEENRKTEEEKLRRTFQEKEHFCRNLEEIALYAENHPTEVSVMKDELRRLLAEFLSDRRLSVFDDEEAFVETMVRLKQTVRTAKRYAED